MFIIRDSLYSIKPTDRPDNPWHRTRKKISDQSFKVKTEETNDTQTQFRTNEYSNHKNDNTNDDGDDNKNTKSYNNNNYSRTNNKK